LSIWDRVLALILSERRGTAGVSGRFRQGTNEVPYWIAHFSDEGVPRSCACDAAGWGRCPR